MDPSQPRPPGEVAPENPSLEDPGELELAIFDLLRVAMLWNEDRFESLGTELGESHREFLDSFLKLVAKHRGGQVPIGRADRHVLRAKDLGTASMVEAITNSLATYHAEVKRSDGDRGPDGQEELAAVRAKASITEACATYAPHLAGRVEEAWAEVRRPAPFEAEAPGPSGWITRLKGPRIAAVHLFAELNVRTGTRHVHAVLAAAKVDPQLHRRLRRADTFTRELAWIDTWPRTIRFGLKVLGFSDDAIVRLRDVFPDFDPAFATGLARVSDVRRIEYRQGLEPSDTSPFTNYPEASPRELTEMMAEVEGPDQELWREGLRVEDERAIADVLDQDDSIENARTGTPAVPEPPDAT